MNCKKKSFYLPLAIALVFMSCTSTPTTTTEDVVEEPKIEKVEKKEEKKKEEPADIRFVKALQELLEKNDYKGAIKLFEKLPEELKNDVDLRYLQASILYSDSQYDNAISVCNYILTIDPVHKDTIELLSRIYKANGDKSAASKLNDKILEQDPYNPSVNIQKAEEQVLRKKWKLARTYYGRALQGDPDNLDAMYGYAKMTYYLNDLDKAEEILFKILDKDPDNVSALAYIGTIEFDRENYYQACNFVEVALSLDPNNYNNLVDYGTYLRYLGRYDEAIATWNKAISINPDNFLPYIYVASIYDQEKNDYKTALDYYYTAVQKNPKYPYAYESIAVLEYHLGNFDQAAKAFQGAYSFRNSFDYAIMIAACYMQSGKDAEAKKVLEQQMKLLPDHNSTEYALVRFFHDTYNTNAYNSLTRKVNAVENSNVRGKYTFYLGLYNELNGSDKVAEEYYAQVASLQAPMFFEYRLAEWGLQK